MFPFTEKSEMGIEIHHQIIQYNSLKLK